MIIDPIIPIWIMALICILLLIFISKSKKRAIRQIIIIILIFVINLRIKVTSANVETMATNMDVLFVIDNTLSMIAEDYNGTDRRLDAVKADCEYIIDELSGANFSIITFNNESAILTPFTKDQMMTKNAISTIKTMDNLYGKGTTLNNPYENMLAQLEKANEKDSSRKTVVFYISDGEITAEDSSLDSFEDLKEYIDDGAVLGYGTESGGRMKYDSESTDLYYVQDFTGDYAGDAISKIDEENLNKLADDMGIDYIHMTDQSNIDDKLEKIKAETVSDSENSSKSSVDIYYIFVIPLLGLLIYEFIWYKRNL